MLLPAISKEQELNELFKLHSMSDKLKWYQLDYNTLSLSINDNDYNKIEMVSVYKDKVIGFFSAIIDRQAYAVTSLKVINFSDNKLTFAIDLKSFIKYLIKKKKFTKISWVVICNSLLEKHYDRLIKLMGGYVCGIKKRDVFINGEYYDLKIYEWLAAENIAVISGYFNPLHIGHLKLIKEAKKICDRLIVIVNNDKQQLLKKKKIIMDENSRLEIIKSIKYVDEALLSIDVDRTVIKTLKYIRNKKLKDTLFFCNGGDRNSTKKIPEASLCNTHNVHMLFGMGGKIESSTNINKLIEENIRKK